MEYVIIPSNMILYMLCMSQFMNIADRSTREPCCEIQACNSGPHERHSTDDGSQRDTAEEG